MEQCYLKGTQTLATICFTCILPSLSLNRRDMKGRLRWITNWLEVVIRRLTVNGPTSKRMLVKSGVPQRVYIGSTTLTLLAMT